MTPPTVLQTPEELTPVEKAVLDYMDRFGSLLADVHISGEQLGRHESGIKDFANNILERRPFTTLDKYRPVEKLFDHLPNPFTQYEDMGYKWQAGLDGIVIIPVDGCLRFRAYKNIHRRYSEEHLSATIRTNGLGSSEDYVDNIVYEKEIRRGIKKFQGKDQFLIPGSEQMQDFVTINCREIHNPANPLSSPSLIYNVTLSEGDTTTMLYILVTRGYNDTSYKISSVSFSRSDSSAGNNQVLSYEGEDAETPNPFENIMSEFKSRFLPN